MPHVAVGFIGAGFSANLHAHALRAVHGVGVTLAAVAASRPERAADFARRHGVPCVHATWQDLLADPAVDAVSICVPTALHAPVAIAAARAGKHVICEKPLTGAFGEREAGSTARIERERALESVDAVRTAVTQSGVQFLYSENWVYAPAMTKTKRLMTLAKGAVLDIRAEESHSGSHAARTRRRETAGGGALLTLGSHPIGAVLHLKDHEARVLGVRPPRVTAVTADVASLHESEAARRAGHAWLVGDWHDVETWSNLTMTFDDGTRATIAASFSMLGGVRNTFEVYTTNAVYRGNMTPNDSLLVYSPDSAAFGDEYLHEKIETRTGWITASPDEDWVRGYPQEMQDFMEAIGHRREPLSGLTLAGTVVEVIYAGYVAAGEGRRVTL